MPGRPSNPYHFGSPADDAHFTDRVAELAKLEALMLNGQNLIVIAPRRFGKSSLLLQAVKRVRAAGGRTGRVSLIRCASPRDVAAALMKGVVDGPLGWLRGHATELTQRLRRIRLAPEFRINPNTGTIDSVSFGPGFADANWHDVIADVVRALSDADDTGHPVSLILDEFQKAYEISPDIPDLMKDLTDELPRVSLVFAGSKRHLMEAMVSDPDHGALYNVGAKLYLDRIPMPDFVDYLRARAESAGKSLDQGTAERIYDTAADIPDDAKLVAFWAFEHAAASIDEGALNAAVRAAVADQKDEYEELYDGLGLSQQILLKLIAHQPVEHLSGAEVRRDLGVSHNSARKAGEALQKAELIVRQDGRWVVARGLLKEWLTTDYD